MPTPDYRRIAQLEHEPRPGARAMARTATDSLLVDHARRELALLGEDQFVIDGLCRVVQAFADMGHSERTDEEVLRDRLDTAETALRRIREALLTDEAATD